jgi:hypothetical protein
VSPRKGESREEFLDRLRATRPSRAGGKWTEHSHVINKEGEVTSTRIVRRGRKVEKVGVVGRPASMSYLADSEGRIKQFWLKTRPEQPDPVEVARRIAEEIFKPIAYREPLIPLERPHEGMLSTHTVGYAIGDHHTNMLAWRREVGASWDLEIAERTLDRAFDRLVPMMPRTENAFIVGLGDFGHADGPEPVTRRGKNFLDVDTRWQVGAEAIMRMFKRQVDTVARWHNQVHVFVRPGNHDEYTSGLLTACLKLLYEENPRIHVDTTPGHYAYHRFDNCFLGFTHGNRTKPEALSEIMSVDRARDWGETEHRYWWTGHVHHNQTKDFRGCTFDSFRVLPPGDSWHHASGYRAARGMQAHLFSNQDGLARREYITPAMLER